MEKKRKKVSDKVEPSRVEAKPIQPRRIEAKPAPRAQPILNEKDKIILDDVEHIIWNPDLLKKLKDGKAQPPKGYAKKKATLN